MEVKHLLVHEKMSADNVILAKCLIRQSDTRPKTEFRRFLAEAGAQALRF